ncbi:baseplate J/gp47 family protein [Escherichia coli]|uniref:baseplate J/gp47 family protein n=1 Tax=Escherichia coli TaxID=562 RepID=UPI00292D1672|nr:baseplate J/gp47 family protein [Escherichia coli]
MALNLDTLGLSATVTAQGISAPDYQTILDTLTSYFRQIYGSDAYLEPDSKDGQMVALVALAVHDANNTAIGIYNSFSPTTAQAAALSSNVKINGITRKVATNSTADLLLTGTAGTTISNGSARDKNGIIWNFPASVAIGVDGTVLVTATCANSGSVAAMAGTITTINTPTRGWVSVTNPAAATVGSPAETDAELRIRQGQSVALSSITPFEGVDGAIANVAGVTRHKLYENDTGATDSNGLPPHSISAIVEGGDVTEIAQTIRGNKGQGTATYGTTSVTVPDTYGNPHVISFSRSTDVPIFVAINQDMTISVWLFPDTDISDVSRELIAAIKQGCLTVKAAGVWAGGIEIPSVETPSEGTRFFGFDMDNDYIVGFDAGAWGKLL